MKYQSCESLGISEHHFTAGEHLKTAQRQEFNSYCSTREENAIKNSYRKLQYSRTIYFPSCFPGKRKSGDYSYSSSNTVDLVRVVTRIHKTAIKGSGKDVK